MQDKVLGMLGMAAKAGKLVSGEFSTEKSIQKGKAKLVLLAADASENTKKKFQDKCHYYHIKIYVYADKESLGHTIGKGSRASVAVQDACFAETIEARIRESI